MSSIRPRWVPHRRLVVLVISDFSLPAWLAFVLLNPKLPLEKPIDAVNELLAAFLSVQQRIHALVEQLLFCVLLLKVVADQVLVF